MGFLTPCDLKYKIEELIKNKNHLEVIEFDKKLDHFFFSNISQIENQISHSDDAAYAGLNEVALLTSYLDYYQILQSLPVGGSIVDLGAGYCRGTLLSEYIGLNKCISIEYVPERVKHAQDSLKRISNNNKLIKLRDLSREKIPEAHAYYLYFPKGEVLDQILINLFSQINQYGKDLYVCESHGDLIEYLKIFSNLIVVDEFKSSLPRHWPNIVKFRVNKVNKNISREENLGLWWLFNRAKDYSFVIDFYHNTLEKKIDWIVRFKDVELIVYNGKVAFHHISGRIILISDNEPIKSIIEKHLMFPGLEDFTKFKKLLFDKNFIYEDNNGVLHSI